MPRRQRGHERSLSPLVPEYDTLSNGFTVTAGAPVLLSATPSSGQQGQQNLSVALAGQFTNWVQGTTIASFGAGITVASLTVTSPTAATAIVNINSAAATGARTITLTTGSEIDTLSNSFTVTASTPTLLSANCEQRSAGSPELIGCPYWSAHKLGTRNNHSSLRRRDHGSVIDCQLRHECDGDSEH